MSTAAQLQVGPLIFHSMLELILTCVLLFGVTTIVTFVVGPSPISRALAASERASPTRRYGGGAWFAAGLPRN